MPNYRELLQQVRSEISELDATSARELIEHGDPVVVDVREQEEWDEGRIPGAVHIPRGHLESRIERAAPDPTHPVVLYCSVGNRSAFAAKTLAELGYEDVTSLAGGFTDWTQTLLADRTERLLVSGAGMEQTAAAIARAVASAER